MSAQPSRRRSPPLVVGLVLSVMAAATLASATLALLAWQEASQIQALQAEVDFLQGERQTAESQLAALQSTVKMLENRLIALETDNPAQQLAELKAAVEMVGEPQQIADLQTSLAEIQKQLDGFQADLDDLVVRLDALEPANAEAGEGLPPEARLAIVRQRQQHNLSCESSAASMVAQYLGIDLSEAEALADLPLHDNPHWGFRGNVDGLPGGIEDYGVYAGPIMDVLNSHGLQAWLVKGGLDGIKAAIAQGNPVIAWVTYNCLPSTPMETTIDGQTVTLVPNQHAVVVTGYDAGGVWANDPWDGQEDYYPAAEFERAMGYFGNMAIEVTTP